MIYQFISLILRPTRRAVSKNVGNLVYLMPQLPNPSFHIVRMGIPQGGNRRDKTGDATYLTSPGPGQSLGGRRTGRGEAPLVYSGCWSRAISSSPRSQSGPSHTSTLYHPVRTVLLGEDSWTLSESSQALESLVHPSLTVSF